MAKLTKIIVLNYDLTCYSINQIKKLFFLIYRLNWNLLIWAKISAYQTIKKH